jgi:FkbH-like protein
MFDALNQRPEQRRAFLGETRLPADLTGFEPAYPVRSASFMIWGQHCDMCAAPACYKTCDLFEQGHDRRCQTFVYGIGRNRELATIHPYAMECAFKGHAHLFTHLTLDQWPLGLLGAFERAYAGAAEPLMGIGDRLNGISLFQRAGIWSLTKGVLYKLEPRKPQRLPDGLLVQIFNPNPEPVQFIVDVRNRNPGKQAIGFREGVRLRPGFNEHLFPIEQIAENMDLAGDKRISLFPDGQHTCLLVVMAADMVGLKAMPWAETTIPPDAKPVKCVAFDLDNTLWPGVLLEEPQGLPLGPNVMWLLKELDRRGILMSIVSKNNPDEALARLRALGIEEYFLHPQIGWGPKSQGLERIARALNIGIDTLALVDDSPFERAEVAAALPRVRLFTERDLPLLHRHPLLAGSTEGEGADRRLRYWQAARRDQFREQAGLDYEAFLRECRMNLIFERPRAADLNRLHELAQRTNQLNFSSNRYTREELERLIAGGDEQEAYDCLLARAADRFGEYGVVGMAIVRRRAGEPPCLIDLALSCRVQARRVEHGILLTILEGYRRQGEPVLEIVYNRTERNAPAGQVFADLELTEARREGERIFYRQALDRPFAPPNLFAIEDRVFGVTVASEPETGTRSGIRPGVREGAD